MQELDILLCSWLELMKMFLATYIGQVLTWVTWPGGKWGTKSLEVAEMAEWGPWLAQ